MQSGKLRHRVSIENRSNVTNEFGEQEKTWTPRITVWAEVRPLSGREYFAAGQLKAEVTHRVRTRYRPGVTTTDRLVFEGRALDIVTVINVDAANQELEILCKESV